MCGAKQKFQDNNQDTLIAQAAVVGVGTVPVFIEAWA